MENAREAYKKIRRIIGGSEAVTGVEDLDSRIQPAFKDVDLAPELPIEEKDIKALKYHEEEMKRYPR